MWALLAKWLAGPFGWLVRLALKYVWEKGLKGIQKAVSDWNRARAQKKATEKLKENTEKPREEKRQDEEDYLNS